MLYSFSNDIVGNEKALQIAKDMLLLIEMIEKDM